MADCFQKAYSVLQLREQKRRQPRAKVRFKPLDANTQTKIVSPLREKLDRLDGEIGQKIGDLERTLEHWAEAVEFPKLDQSLLIDRVSGASYHSQGFGCNRYARGSLELKAALLESRGFTAEIRVTDCGKPDRWGISFETYELWSNCCEGAREALKYWRMDQALMHKVSRENGALNLKVYNYGLENYWDR